MLDLSIDFFSNFRNSYKNIFAFLIAITSLCGAPLQARTPGSEECLGKFLETLNCTVHEATSIEDSVSLLISLRDTLISCGYTCPSLTELCANLRYNLGMQGILVDENQFEMLYEEIVRQEHPLSFQMATNFNQELNFILIKDSKNDKKESKLNSKTICGLVKCLAGGLMCVIPVPVVQAAGVGLVTTGISDCIDGAREIGDENQRSQQMDEQRRKER